MGQQETNANQHDDQQNLDAVGASSSRKPESQREADRQGDRSIGSGASGEGAGSALEAMLKRRQLNVETVPDTIDAPPIPPLAA